MIADVRCQEFIDRDEERQMLGARCRDAGLGRGSMVVISGESGIGKTRLIAEIVRVAKGLSMQTSTGYCLEHARSPLGPLSDIVRTLHKADESILRAAQPMRQMLARLVPEIEPNAPPVNDTDGARSQYVAIAEMFRRCGERRPQLIVLEDAHWADLSTVEFLKYFAGKVGGLHVVFLILLRADETDARHFGPLLSQLRRQPNTHAIELVPFAPAHMQQFVRAAMGTQQLSHDGLRRIRELADGNPLFAEELLASALDNDAAPRELPASVREIFFERIRQLNVEDRDILVEAAVLGRRFDPVLLAQFTNRPVERILLALRHARELQLIVEDAGDGAVFRHVLVRETLYQSILIAEARRLHRRIASELEVLPDRETHTAALAYHSWAARDMTAALAYNELAGDDAMRKLATNEAALFFERALACATRAPDMQSRLYRKLADAYSGSGLAGRAIEMFTRAYEQCQGRADVRAMAEISLRIGREHAARAEGDSAMYWRNAGLQTIAVLPEEPIHFDALTTAALAYAWRGEVEAAGALVERARAYTGPRSSFAQYNFHDAVAMVDMLSGAGAAALARYERAGADAVASGAATLAVRTYCNFYTFASVLGQTELASQAAAEAVRLADEILVPMYRPYALIIAGKADAAAGLLESARQRLAQAQDASAGLDSPRVDVQLMMLGLFLAQHLDEPALTDRYADARAIDHAFASREPWWIGGVSAVFADLYGRSGREEQARDLIKRALGALPTIILSPELALTAAAYGADADLPLVRDRLCVWRRVAAPECGRAFLDLFDAYAARRANRSPVALGKAAAERFESLRLPFLAARAYEVAGERAAAVQIYVRVGSTADIGGLSVPRTTVEVARAQLTKREQEVFALVADGRSNREIASVMNISERTVESHIRSILSKVDGRSRVDLIKLAQTRPRKFHATIASRT